MDNAMRILIVIFLTWGVTACGVNPVTGRSEIQLVSPKEEIAMGEKNYVPMQQSQGGTYEVDKTLSVYVNQVGKKLTAVSDRQLPYEFVVINSSVPNAWALPGGKIAVNRGLLVELNNEAELAAVLGHEIVHAAARHSAKKIETGMAMSLGLVVLGFSQRDSQWGQVAMVGGGVAAALLGQKYSRDDELEADKYSVQYMVKAGYDPYAAVTLQETFVRLAKGQNPSWLDGLFASHPPSEERVIANREYAKALYRPGLSLGEQRYKAEIAGLLKSKPAYAKYDQAAAALAKKDLTQANSLIDQAIAIEPREGMFYAMKGNLYEAQHNHQAAIKAYDQAVSRNPDFFYFYLKRGMSLKAVGENARAKSDLQKSYALLPTKQAQQGLQSLK
jgi:predicted Zn-dependent protease